MKNGQTGQKQVCKHSVMFSICRHSSASRVTATSGVHSQFFPVYTESLCNLVYTRGIHLYSYVDLKNRMAVLFSKLLFTKCDISICNAM